MRILGMLRADKYSEAGTPPSKELIERMGTFVEEVTGMISNSIRSVHAATHC